MMSRFIPALGGNGRPGVKAGTCKSRNPVARNLRIFHELPIRQRRNGGEASGEAGQHVERVTTMLEWREFGLVWCVSEAGLTDKWPLEVSRTASSATRCHLHTQHLASWIRGPIPWVKETRQACNSYCCCWVKDTGEKKSKEKKPGTHEKGHSGARGKADRAPHQVH